MKNYSLNLPILNLSGKYIYSICIADDIFTDSIRLTDSFNESRELFLEKILPTILRWRGLYIPKNANVQDYRYSQHYKYTFQPIEWLNFKNEMYESAKYNLNLER